MAERRWLGEDCKLEEVGEMRMVGPGSRVLIGGMAKWILDRASDG